MVAGFRSNSPDEPGVVTGTRSVTGPLQVTSKLQLATADTGDWKRNNAFGMLKSSCSTKPLTLMFASPEPRSIEVKSDQGKGTAVDGPIETHIYALIKRMSVSKRSCSVDPSRWVTVPVP